MMIKKLNTKTICLAAVAAFLVVTLTIGTAMAYFTTYATAKGGYQIKLGNVTPEIEEDVDLIDPRKEITLKNTGDFDCFVRLIVFAGSVYEKGMSFEEIGGKDYWSKGADGYYYYSEVLAPGEETTQLNVSFVFPEDVKDPFNVIVVEECAPVIYEADGTPYADWDRVAKVSQSESVEAE